MTGDEEQVVTLTSAKVGVGAGRPRQWLLRLSALSILFALLPLWSIGCLFGDNKEEETDQFRDRVSVLRTAQANAPSKTKRIPTIPPTATPVAKTDGQARMLVWIHLSLCTAIDSRTLTAVKVKDDWFVRASDSSPVNPGIWKVDTATGALEPYDALARSWNSLVQSQCSPEILATLTTPTPLPTTTLAVGNANDAEVAVWAYLIQCDPSLSTRQFEAKWNHLSGKWVITSDSDSEVNYGVWTLRGDTGELLPNAHTSRQWANYVESSCSSEVLAAFATPTPIAPPTPAVKSAGDAVISVWSFLVGCFPDLPVQTLEAKWNPSAGEWVAVTKAGATTDYGVWTVLQNGTVRAGNREAESREGVVKGGAC
jgi:hypothetical protein